MKALVRRPSPRLSEGLLTHLDRRPVDFHRAVAQWETYVDVLRQNDWEIVEVPDAPECPDSAFVEDTAVMFGNTAVQCRMGAVERRPESAGTASTLTALGYRPQQLTSPATLDGGDVLKAVDTAYVALSGRTNAAGIEQLESLISPLGWKVVPVPTSLVLHLKSAVTALPDGTVLGFPPVVDDASLFTSFLAMPEEEGAHVVLLGENRVLISASAPRSSELLSEMGYVPFPVDISEFEKLEGCVTCLSIRLRHDPNDA